MKQRRSVFPPPIRVDGSFDRFRDPSRLADNKPSLAATSGLLGSQFRNSCAEPSGPDSALTPGRNVKNACYERTTQMLQSCDDCNGDALGIALDYSRANGYFIAATWPSP